MADERAAAGDGRALEQLLAEIRACRVCPLAHGPRPIVQAGTTARVLICGQAPGRRAHEAGAPFTDASGDRLRAWLGIGPEIFYDAGKIAIAPMGFCFPGYDAKGADLPPRRECAPLWRDRLLAALPGIRLRVLIGRYAADWHCPAGRRTRLDARIGPLTEAPGQTLFILPHPSWRNTHWLRKNPWFETDTLPRLREAIDLALA